MRLTTLPDRRRIVFVRADRNGSRRGVGRYSPRAFSVAPDCANRTRAESVCPHKHRILLEAVASEATRAGRLLWWMPPARLVTGRLAGGGHDPGPNLNACCRSAPGSRTGGAARAVESTGALSGVWFWCAQNGAEPLIVGNKDDLCDSIGESFEAVTRITRGDGDDS